MKSATSLKSLISWLNELGFKFQHISNTQMPITWKINWEEKDILGFPRADISNEITTLSVEFVTYGFASADSCFSRWDEIVAAVGLSDPTVTSIERAWPNIKWYGSEGLPECLQSTCKIIYTVIHHGQVTDLTISNLVIMKTNNTLIRVHDRTSSQTLAVAWLISTLASTSPTSTPPSWWNKIVSPCLCE